MIKQVKVRWARHVVRMGKIRHGYNILVVKLQGRNHLEDKDVVGRIILKWLLENKVKLKLSPYLTKYQATETHPVLQ